MKFRFLFLILFLCIANVSFAIEVHYGDSYDGKDVFKLLKERVYNFADNLCIQKTILTSREHQAEIAIGSYISRLTFDHDFVSSQTGQRGLMATVIYRNDRLQLEESFILGECFLQPELKFANIAQIK